MASRRKLKKAIKSETNLLIEDAFIESLNGDEKMDKVIDELIDTRFDVLAGVSNYPNKDKKAAAKHFNELKTKLNASVSEYSKKIGRVS
jgi:hypothetical protein